MTVLSLKHMYIGTGLRKQHWNYCVYAVQIICIYSVQSSGFFQFIQGILHQQDHSHHLYAAVQSPLPACCSQSLLKSRDSLLYFLNVKKQKLWKYVISTTSPLILYQLSSRRVKPSQMIYPTELTHLDYSSHCSSPSDHRDLTQVMKRSILQFLRIKV